MKNDSMKRALGREMENVRVSRDLKERILAEAAVSRAPSKRKEFSLKPLAIAAAVMVTIGLSAGVIALRAEKPDLSATPLSANNASEAVWAGSDGLYHGKNPCGDQADMYSLKPQDARAEGLKACSKCFEPDDKAVEKLVWIMREGLAYHAVPDCSGMDDAVGVMEIEARTLGRGKCMICLDGDVVESYPQLTQEPAGFQILPWEPEQGEIIYAYGTPEATVPPLLTPTPMATTEVIMAQPTPAPTVTPRPSPTPSPMPTAEAIMDLPSPMPTPESVGISSAEDEEFVWVNEKDGFYHSDEHCSGWEDMRSAARREAILSGRKPCDICTERILWTNDGGLSCHLAKNCSGMEDAEVIVLAPGDTSYQVGCLVCAAGGMPVWVSEESEYCHIDEYCGGMANARQIMESEALAMSRQYCPECMIEAGVDSVKADETLVWVKEDGLYYHSDEYCASCLTVEEFAGGGKAPCAVCGAEDLEGAEMAYSDDEYYHAVMECAARTKHQSCGIGAAEAKGLTPCPLCMREEYEKLHPYYTGNVWLTDDGVYYHRARSCMGTKDAYERAIDEAVQMGKQACPECMDEEPVWTDDDHDYYHRFETCTYMRKYESGSFAQDKREIAESAAAEEGKRPCPMCLFDKAGSPIAEQFILAAEAAPLEVLTAKDACYHVDELCSGIEKDDDGFTIVAEIDALKWGKVPCSECIPQRYENLEEVDYAAIGEKLSAGDLWMTEDNAYYHTDRNCSDMKDASPCGITGALLDGKLPCPECAKQFAEVWTTENGHEYHLSDDCMGIVGAQKLTGSEAVERGLTICEKCHAELINALGGKE